MDEPRRAPAAHKRRLWPRRRQDAPPPAAPPPLQALPFDGQDYRTLSQLLGGLWAEAGTARPQQLQWAALRGAIEQGRIQYFIAWLHGQPVGVCSLCRIYLSDLCAPGGLLADLYVLPAARGAGAAAALVQCAAQQVRTWGGERLLALGEAAQLPALRTLGFTLPAGAGLARRV